MATLASRLLELVVAMRTKINAMTPRLIPSGGTAGQVLTKVTAADFNVSWSAAGSGGGQGADVQVFDYTGAVQTWNKPAGAKLVRLWMLSGGGGGSSGMGAASGTATAGGPAGAGSALMDFTLDAAFLPATATVTVGRGGTGSTASGVNKVAGGNGTASVVAGTNFSITCSYALGGSASTAGGGNSSSGQPDGLLANYNFFAGSPGGVSTSGGSGSSSASQNLFTCGGGGGGGVSAAAACFNGGTGYSPKLLYSYNTSIYFWALAGTAGNSTTTNGGNGANGVGPGGLFLGGQPGAGGGSGVNGGNGGNGGLGSGGGGGGNCVGTANTPGKGGDGGHGRVIIVTTF